MNCRSTILLFNFLLILGCGKTAKQADLKEEIPETDSCTCGVQLDSFGIGKKNPVIEEGLLCDSLEFLVDEKDMMAMKDLGFSCGAANEVQQTNCSRGAHPLDCKSVEESCIAAKNYAKKVGTCKLFGP